MLTLCLSFAIVLLDQLAKTLVRYRFALGDRLGVIDGLFDLRYVRNTGAAWGMLSGLNGWLVLLSLVMLVLIVRFRRVFTVDTLMDRLALGAMIGGIVGNLIDRAGLGYVVDFLDFYWRGHHFPAFNVADSAICVGVGLYMIAQFQRGEPDDSGAEADACPGRASDA